MGIYDEEDLNVPETNLGAETRPIYGKRLPFGLRISEIKSGSRQPRAKDPDRQKTDEDVFLKFKLVSQELLALWDILFREGIITGKGMHSGDKPGEEPPGAPPFWQGGGGAQFPPWWGSFLKWLQYWIVNMPRLIAIIKLLMQNK